MSWDYPLSCQQEPVKTGRTTSKVLIKRTTRNIFLTEQGEAVLTVPFRCWKKCEDMFSQVRSFSEPEASAPSSSVAYGFNILPELITSYQKYPLVKFHVNLNDNIINLSKQLDMVLRITKSYRV